MGRTLAVSREQRPGAVLGGWLLCRGLGGAWGSWGLAALGRCFACDQLLGTWPGAPGVNDAYTGEKGLIYFI